MVKTVVEDEGLVQIPSTTCTDCFVEDTGWTDLFEETTTWTHLFGKASVQIDAEVSNT